MDALERREKDALYRFLVKRAEAEKKREMARRRQYAREYAQELRDTRRRLNIMPLKRVPYDISK